MGPAGGDHAPRHRARRFGPFVADGSSQQRELVDQALQHALERVPDLAVGGGDLGFGAGGADDQVDRPMLEVEPPPVGQQADLRAGRHGREVQACSGTSCSSIGQGLAGRCGSERTGPRSIASSSATTSSP